MRQLGTVVLNVEPASETMPARVSIALAGARPDDKGIMYMTPDCMTLDEIEGQINRLQDELDVLRAEARRIFADQTTVGPRSLLVQREAEAAADRPAQNNTERDDLLV